jgi:NADPH:quinone reductase-like Zn-dependent oxidoreductase
MKAAIRRRYGPPDVVQIGEIEKPVPKDTEILIGIRAAALNPLDLFQLRGAPVLRGIPGMRKPKQEVLGCDIAGQVEAVGRQTKQFQPGDAVFGVTGFAGGGFAEYVCTTEDKVAMKPVNCSFEQAAAIPIAGLTALQGLRDKGRIQAGQRVLVYGASGGVGTFAVQIAKSFGAEVTGVCSTGKMEATRSIGADHVIDYTRDDFTKSGELYDLILGANSHQSIFDCRRALKPGGTYVVIGGGVPQIVQAVILAPFLSRIGSKKACFFIAKIIQKDLISLKELVEGGKVVPIIDRTYPLRDVVEALRYLEQRHAKGKVVLTVEHGNEN